MKCKKTDQNIEIKAIIDSIQSAILCVDNAGRIKYLNSEAEQLLKVNYKSVQYMRLEELLPFMKEHSNVIKSCLQKKTTMVLERITSEIFGLDQYVNIYISPYFGNGISGMTIKFKNITEKMMEIEEKIKMEKAVSLAYLSKGIAHSINNPLSGITIALANINNRLFKKTKRNVKLAISCGCKLEQIKDYIDKQNITNMHHDILEQIHRVAIIIKNTLSFGSARIQQPIDYYNINAIIKNAVYMSKLEKDLNGKLLFKNINIVQSNKKLPFVKCNHVELSLVLLHLLKNSYSSISKVQLKNHKPAVHIRTYIKNKTCCIEVEDNGIGIKEHDYERMFEPFFSTDCKLPGLGLAICNSIIVNHHKGKIYPKKKVKEGAIFIIELPITDTNYKLI